jgi:hypothetical protein
MPERQPRRRFWDNSVNGPDSPSYHNRIGAVSLPPGVPADRRYPPEFVATYTPGRRFIYHDAAGLVGKPLAGNGQCVALVQKYLPEIGHTSTWRAGPRVQDLTRDEIRIGTVIGNMEHGRWPGRAHNNHVGIYGGAQTVDPVTGKIITFVLVEQFVAPGVTKIQARVIHSKGFRANGAYIDSSNNADAYFVIEK